MTKYKRIGIFAILIGVCIPIISFAFANGYNPKLGFWWSISRMNVILWTHEEIQKPSAADNPDPKDEWVDINTVSVVLPYKYPFSLGIILIFSGSSVLVLSKQKKYD